jgi:lipoprotein NlpD
MIERSVCTRAGQPHRLRATRLCKRLFGISLLFTVVACTTTVPAPVVDRSRTPSLPPPSAPIESRESRLAPPATFGTPSVIAQPQPQPQSLPPTGVTTAGAPQANIVERAAPPAIVGSLPGNTSGSQFHVVQRGETLYRIAVNNGLSVDALAAWNNLPPGDASIREGQVLRLRPADGAITSVTPITGQPLPSPGPGAIAGVAAGAPIAPIAPIAPMKTEPRAQRLPYSDSALTQMQRGDSSPLPPTGAVSPSPSTSAPPSGSVATGEPPRASPPASAGVQPLSGEPEIKPGNGVERDGVAWTWPTTGRLASRFSDRAPMKGVDIVTKSGAPVVAAAAGKVIYVGKEPRGYGQMIVVSHAKETVSVYFHTDKVSVKEQQRVTLGQRIAEVAEGADNKMHFEVRRQGRPLDPLTLMPSR